MRSSCWGGHLGGRTVPHRNGTAETEGEPQTSQQMAIPISGRVKKLLITTPHKPSAPEGRDVAVAAEPGGGLALLPPGLRAGRAGAAAVGDCQFPPHQKQPVSLLLPRGERSVGLSPADPAAAPQAAGLQSPCEGLTLP